MTAVLSRPAALPDGFRLHLYDVLDSTNDEALRRLAAGVARPGDVIVARLQSKGRGRRGRRWESPAGNLHLTLVAATPPARLPAQLAFVAALAAGGAIMACVPAACDLRYKWPNDMLVEGQKVGGILIEGSGDGQGWAVGIGLDIERAPAEASFPAVALRAIGAEMTAEDLVAPICAGFAHWHARWAAEGFAPVRATWLARARGIGAPIEVRLPDGAVLNGTFRDLDPAGALLLEGPTGLRTIAAGDVFFPRG